MKRRSVPLESVSRPRGLVSSRTNRTVVLGFYSLFSVTEEPFVTSGGNRSLLDARLAIDSL
jgi:hypothetical protein